MSLALAQFGFGAFLSGFGIGWFLCSVCLQTSCRRKRDSRGRFIKQHAK